jgi:hypothetical protein
MLEAPVWHTDHPVYGPLATALTSVDASWQMLVHPSDHGLRGVDPQKYDARWRDNMREALKRAMSELDALETGS